MPLSPPGPTRDLSHWLDNARFEIVPVAGVDERVRGHVDCSRTLTVTCSPRSGIDRTIDVAATLAIAGYDVVPHLAARTVASRAHLHDVLARADDAGVRDLFVVGGDGTPIGPYPSALALLDAVADSGRRFADVGIAGYPEAHPSIDAESLLTGLVEKQDYATYIVTQMCFDPETIVRWIDVIRDRGVDLPVYVGVPGTVGVRRLMTLGSTIGVGDSISYLRKHATLVQRLLRRRGYDPRRFLAQLERAGSEPAYGIRGLHVFTFNTVAETQRSLARIARERLAPGPSPEPPAGLQPAAPPSRG
jgi:methylenetetrahydrofolate reductase (NADPH)